MAGELMRGRKKRRKKISAVVEQQKWKLSLLREFVARHGWAGIKADTDVRGVNLHRWVTHRRADYRADRIPDWLVPECEAIPGWSWNVFRDAYVRNLDNLRAFVRKHGWEALAMRPVVDGTRLDRWVAHRRAEYKNGELDTWLVRGLEAIPGWTWDPRRAGYERNIRELRDYVAAHGWASLDTHTVTTKGFSIGNWITVVRSAYRRGELEEWVAAELEKVRGWTWEPRVAEQLANAERLAAFVARHGWDAVTRTLVVDDVKLGLWVHNCRGRYRRGQLSPETIAALEAIPDWSWSGAELLAARRRERAELVESRIVALEELRGVSGQDPRKRRGRVPRASARSPRPRAPRSSRPATSLPVSIPIPSKSRVVTELVALTRAAGRPLPSYELPFALYNALLHHFGGIHAARRAAKLPDPPQYREWSQADVVAEVRRLYDAGLTIRYRDLELAGREDLVGAIRVYAGSIVRARVLAKVPHPPRAAFLSESWDEDRVVEDILELHRAAEPLAYSKAPSKLVNAGERYFGSWDNALFAAGLDPDEIRLRRRPYGEEELLARIRQLARDKPSMNLGELHGHPDAQALSRRYGSLHAGLRVVGLTEWPVRLLHDAPTADEVIAALKARHRAGRCVRSSAIREDSRLHLGIARRFKTLDVALAAAGIRKQ